MGNQGAANTRTRPSYSRIAFCCGICLAIYAVDQLTKLLAIRLIKESGPIALFDGLLILAYVENGGAFLGMGGNWPFAIKVLAFIVLPLFACVAGLVYACRSSTKSLQAFAVLCIVGGGLGNLRDRIFNNGQVVDFLNFGLGSLRTGILNVGDLAVTFGALALVLLSFREEREHGKAT
jgi:signal peptidase II